MEIEILKHDAQEDRVEYFESLFFNTLGFDVEFKEVEDFDRESFKLTTLDFLRENPSTTKFFLIYNSTDFRGMEDQEIAKLGRTTPECLGMIDLSKDVGHYIPFVTSFLTNQSIMQTQKSLLKKLNGVMQSVLGQLQRVKGLHEKVVPVRNESFRGVDLSSRFCAGTSSGGEFFDIFKSGSDLWFFSINASSYITIGTFLSLIESWKQTKGLSFELILEALRSNEPEFKGLGDISILISKMELSTFATESLNIGSHEIVGSDKVFVGKNKYKYPDSYETAQIEKYQLERGDQILLLSPGFFKNTDGQISDQNYYQFIKTNWTSGQSLIQELTFQSKKKYNELDFMPYDQTIITVGVNKNAISKI